MTFSQNYCADCYNEAYNIVPAKHRVPGCFGKFQGLCTAHMLVWMYYEGLIPEPEPMVYSGPDKWQGRRL